MRTPLADDSMRKCLIRSELLSPVLTKGQMSENDIHTECTIYEGDMIKKHWNNPFPPVSSKKKTQDHIIARVDVSGCVAGHCKMFISDWQM